MSRCRIEIDFHKFNLFVSLLAYSSSNQIKQIWMSRVKQNPNSAKGSQCQFGETVLFTPYYRK